MKNQPVSCICVGASAGGVAALQTILGRLSKSFQVPIIVAQHIPADGSFDWQLVFGRNFFGAVIEANDKMSIAPGHAYFAPPAYHLLTETDGTLSLSLDEPIHFARPSIDVLFESAAQAFGSNLCGVLLSGANQDGSAGLLEIKNVGGITIVQDPLTAESKMMPESALEKMNPDYVGSLEGIAGVLNELKWRQPR